MTFRELYNYKLYEYINYNIREELDKLLAILLLDDADFYVNDKKSLTDFYNYYKKFIDYKIAQIEKDYSINNNNYASYFIDKDKIFDSDTIPTDKIWVIYKHGIEALYVTAVTGRDPEDVYKEYFDSSDLEKEYDIEKLALACNIDVTRLSDVLETILDNTNSFYKKISEALTPDERMFIINHLEGRSCFNCTNPECRVEFHEKIGIDENGNPQGNKCIGWKDDILIGKAKVLKLNSIKKLNDTMY